MPIRNVCSSLVLLLLVTPVTAHGGQYRGPSEVTPPPSGGSGSSSQPASGATSGPAVPAPSGSTSGASGAPAAAVPTATAAAPPSAPRGAPPGPDLTRWQYWWEFHKDPFLNLKEAVHHGTIAAGSDEFFMAGRRGVSARDTLKPSDSDIEGQVLPDLLRALETSDDRDVTSGCLIALGKVGRETATIKTLEVIRRRLQSPDLEIRGAAALALGISQLPSALPDLVDVAKDTARGRELCARAEVDHTTRAFACYGLGLIAAAHPGADGKRQCFECLREVLARETADRNVPIAAIHGIRLVTPARDGNDKSRLLLEDCLSTLWSFYERRLGAGDQVVQAHVPPAIASLLGRGGDKTGKYEAAFAKALHDEDRRNDFVVQSAAIALGMLCQPRELDAADAPYSDLLLQQYQDGRDQQTRSFCLIALGRIGGESNRSRLLEAMRLGSKGLEKPWAALALGVLESTAQRAGAPRDLEIGRTLHEALASVKNPETQAAIAVALGLVKHHEATDDLLALLARYASNDELAGYLCIGLALMGEARAIGPIRDLVQGAVRRPDLLKQAAIALGKLGDKAVASLLQEMLKDPNRNVARLSAISAALGFIGDRRSVAPLGAMLQDKTITPLSRAFAAVALGGVADKEALPWNSKIASDMNYRAAVETLTNGSTGVLDIL